jgi:hypothetical protein
MLMKTFDCLSSCGIDEDVRGEEPRCQLLSVVREKAVKKDGMEEYPTIEDFGPADPVLWRCSAIR